MDEKLSVTLPDDLARAVRTEIEAGTFASPSDLVREAVRDLLRHRAARADKDDGLAAIRAKIEEAIADPRPSIPLAEVEAHMRRLIAARTKS